MQMGFSRQVENMIADLRGLPRDRSVSRPRETKAMASLVSGVLEKYRVGLPSREDTIMANWEQVVGAANTQYAHLTRIENDRMVFISVTHSVVRQELYFHRKLILDRIKKLPGCSDLRDLRLLSA
jgi:hypothetical protein